MNINDQIFYKAELLTKGMRASDNAKAILYKEFPDFFTKGIMHSLNVRFSETNCNVSIADNFAHESPYLLDEKDGNFFITDGKNSFPVSFFGALPHTGTVVDDFARLHSKGCVTIWPNSNCCYDRENEKCRFCSIVKERETPLDADVLADSIKKLFELSKDNMLNFSGGTYKNPDVMADYWIDLVKKIRAFSDAKIAIEFAPPSDLEKIAALKNAGTDVAIMNLEVANDELRKKICPGKSKISYDHYYKAFEKAVGVFGWGQVSSVLIAGIQPKEDIMAECEKMAKIGVFPTVMPIRPLDNAPVDISTRCKTQDLIEIATHLSGLLVKYNLDFKKQEGCTKCGGCSIENDCYRKQLQSNN